MSRSTAYYTPQGESEENLTVMEEAIVRYGAPDIFNTDQGAQFTSEAFTGALKAHGVRISMDGKGRWLDNVYVERLWRGSSRKKSTGARTRR